MNRKELRECEKRLAEELRQLIASPEAALPDWHGSKTDLAEACLYMWRHCGMTDGEGQPLTFMGIVRMAFARFGQGLPCNPYALAARARERKGARCSTLAERLMRRRQRHDGALPATDTH